MSASPSRISIRVYSVTENGAVRHGRRKVFNEDLLDAEVAANPMRFPPCQCLRCRGSAGG